MDAGLQVDGAGVEQQESGGKVSDNADAAQSTDAPPTATKAPESPTAAAAAAGAAAPEVMTKAEVAEEVKKEEKKPNADAAEPEKCTICLNVFENQEVGVVDDGHFFCRICISVWLESTSTCPIDRNPVTTLTVRESLHGRETSKQKVAKRTQQSDGADLPTHVDLVFCEVCFTGQDPALLLLCDHCNKGLVVRCEICVFPPSSSLSFCFCLSLSHRFAHHIANIIATTHTASRRRWTRSQTAIGSVHAAAPHHGHNQ